VDGQKRGEPDSAFHYGGEHRIHQYRQEGQLGWQPGQHGGHNGQHTRTPCRYAAGRQGRPAVLTKASPVTVWTGLWYMPYPAVREIDPLPVWCMPVSVYTTDRNKNDPK